MTEWCALANRRLQPLGHVSGQVIQLASPGATGNKASIAACLPPFLHQDVGGCWCFLVNRKDRSGAQKTESPGEEIGTEALHCEGDDPHAKHRITIERRLVCPGRHCAMQKNSADLRVPMKKECFSELIDHGHGKYTLFGRVLADTPDDPGRQNVRSASIAIPAGLEIGHYFVSANIRDRGRE